MRLAAAALAALLATLPTAAFAHVVKGVHGPPAWSFEPWAVAPLLLTAVLYAVGHARLRARSSRGGPQLLRSAALFWSGWLTIALAITSPLHEMGGQSFTAHMIEHELIMLAAAPLLVASRPLAALTWALPAACRRALGAASHSQLAKATWRLLTDPLVATATQGTVLWIWHLPGLFDLALAHEAWHAAQHLCFFVSALLFWSAMIGVRRSTWMAAVCLFATSLITGALGGFMALSASPWYAAYASLGLAPWGLTPTEDQQLAGLLMWLPGGAFHAVVAAALLSASLREHRLN